MVRPTTILHAAIALLALFAAALAGCAKRAPGGTGTITWYAGRARPAFDPDGPSDALRVALERHLSRGLVERAADGAIEPALAESIRVSDDSLTWTFRLRDGLRFTDDSPVTSAHIRDALEAGLGRHDHATRSWLLGAVRGVREVRAGRALPVLGIEAPDARTLRLRLATLDRRLLEKLAVPGVSTPWKTRRGEWSDAVGVGPYQVATAGERELTLVPAAPVAGVAAALDTLRVRFEVGAARARAMLRHDRADVLWPLPPALLERPLPDDWTVRREPAEPERRLLLVLRADVPPLTRASARQGLAHALNREELLAALGTRGSPLRRWLAGAKRNYEWPRLETASDRAERLAAEARDRPAPGGASARGRARARERERLADRVGSHHIVLALDADLAGAEVAAALQGQWERAGHYVDVRALRGPAAAAEALRAAAAQAQLVEAQAPFPGVEAELAMLVMPLRGPAVGSFRTGWRTREYDRWITATGTLAGPDPDAIQAVLAAERIVLPIAALPWQVAVRNGIDPPVVHPAYGPEWTRPRAPAEPRTR
jgi:hypothetical protein